MEYNYFLISDNIHEIVSIIQSTKYTFAITITTKYLFPYFYFSSKIVAFERSWIYIDLNQFIHLKHLDVGTDFEKMYFSDEYAKEFYNFYYHKLTTLTTLQSLNHRYTYMNPTQLDFETMTNFTSISSRDSSWTECKYTSSLKKFKGIVRDNSDLCEKYSFLVNLNAKFVCHRDKHIHISSYKTLTKLVLINRRYDKILLNEVLFENVIILSLEKIDLKYSLLKNLPKLTNLILTECKPITLGKNINNLIYISLKNTIVNLTSPLTKLNELIMNRYLNISSHDLFKIYEDTPRVKIRVFDF